MNWEDVRSRWGQMKGSALIEWGKLTGEDFDQIAGERDRLLGKLKQLYGDTTEQAERRISLFVGHCGCVDVGGSMARNNAAWFEPANRQ